MADQKEFAPDKKNQTSLSPKVSGNDDHTESTQFHP